MLTMKPDRSFVSIGRLPISFDKRRCRGESARARVERDDDLDQRHNRHRREEVQSEHALGTMRRLRELGDRDRGGVRGDHAVISRGAADRLHHLELQLPVLGHGLDHEIRAGDRLQIGRQLDPLAREAGLRRVELAASDRPRKRRLDLPPCPPDADLVYVT
jgi:hypothetical protein